MRQKNNRIRVCFASSSGGHLEQLIMLKPLMDKYVSLIVTERVDYKIKIGQIPILYVLPINRTDKSFIVKLFINFVKAFFIIVKFRPNYIVSTGALAAIPLMIYTKMIGGKVIYIESFAKIDSPNLTGKIVYKFADQFYVQWESMKNIYPKAIYKGGIY